MNAPGFVHYFKGPTSSDGTCMSFCLWSDRAAARAAAGRPRHAEAAALALEMYARYDLEFHRVTQARRRVVHLRAVRSRRRRRRFAPGFATS